MVVQSQYYTSKVIESSDTESCLDVEQRVETASKELFCGNWVKWDEISEGDKHTTVLIHAPSSLLDMRRVSEGISDFIELKDTLGRPATLVDGEVFKLGLLPCRNLCSEWFTRYIEESSELLSLNSALVEQHVRKIGASYREYGDFQPSFSDIFCEGDGINPVLFSVATALKIRRESVENEHTGRICVVSHPDQLFFISNGSRGHMREIAQAMESFYRLVGTEVFIENPIFYSRGFVDTLGWLQNPLELADIVPKNSKYLGVCIDGMHLERLGYTGEQVNNMLLSLIHSKYKVALHVDNTFSVKDTQRPYILTAYNNALPIAYEPRS